MLDRFESLEAVSSLPFEVVANDKRTLIWPDAFGRRPSVLAIAKRMAAEAYSVLLSNRSPAPPRRRCSKTRRSSTSPTADRAKLGPLMEPLSADDLGIELAMGEGCPPSPSTTVDRLRGVSLELLVDCREHLLGAGVLWRLRCGGRQRVSCFHQQPQPLVDSSQQNQVTRLVTA